MFADLNTQDMGKLEELRATLQKAIDELNAMATREPYKPKKGDRVEALREGTGGKGLTFGTIGQRGTVAETCIIPYVRMDHYNETLGGMDHLDIKDGYAACFHHESLRPLTPEEIAAEELAKRPKVGDWVRHTDGCIGQSSRVRGDVCEVLLMGYRLNVNTNELTVIPKPE